MIVITAVAATALSAWWSGYRQSSRSKELQALRAQLPVDSSETVRWFAKLQGKCPWQKFRVLERPADVVFTGERTWSALECVAEGARDRDWPGRGLIVGCDGENVAVDRAQLSLPADMRAQRVDEAGWLAFIRRVRLQNAYQFGPVSVDIEHLDLELVDAIDGAPLAVASLEALPPRTQAAGGAAELYSLEEKDVVALVRAALNEAATANN